VRVRTAAIGSLGQLDKKNGNIEADLIADLGDGDFDIRLAAVFALGERGDPAAIEPLQALKDSPLTPSGTGPMIEQQINRLKNPGRNNDERSNAGDAKPPAAAASEASAVNAASGETDRQIMDRLGRLEAALNEVNDRLKKIEQQVSARPVSQ
jgi:hypothetical protein